MPNTDSGKTIAARNATTHGLFSRDVVLPALGEDPEGYKQLESQWLKQLPPRTLLERHYVEKIAAASWRLRRLHRWQAQIFEDPTLTEMDRLDRVDKTLRHETTLHRQIDTSVKMLSKDAPELDARQAQAHAMDSTQTTLREYLTNKEEAVHVELKAQDRLRQVRFDTEAAAVPLTDLPLDAAAPLSKTDKVCENELSDELTLLLPAASFATGFATGHAAPLISPAENGKLETGEPENAKTNSSPLAHHKARAARMRKRT